MVVLASLAVPRCGHCHELVFDADAEEQINRAHQAHILALTNGGNSGKNLTDPARASALPAS